MNARVVFMGSPDFALPTLEELHRRTQVVGVVTQPDRPAGRGRLLMPCPVRQLAEKLEIPVFQPLSLRKPDALEQLSAWQPDLIVVAAFGQILPKNVLALPPKGCLNVHASLLPRWRGASPIQAAILAGDERSGVTIMLMEEGLDTGPILAQRTVPIRPGTTGAELSQQLSFLGAATLIEILPSYLSGMLAPLTQADGLATYAPLLKRSDGLLDFTQSALALTRKVHAYSPWPGTYFILNGKQIKVLDAHPHDTFESEVEGRYIVNGLPAVGTSEGLLVLDQLQPEGKRGMSGGAFLNGQPNWL